MNNEVKPTLNLPKGIDPSAWISEILGTVGTIGGAALGGPLGAGIGGAAGSALGSAVEQQIRDKSINRDKLLKEAIISGVAGALLTGGVETATSGKGGVKYNYQAPSYKGSGKQYVGSVYQPNTAEYIGGKYTPKTAKYVGSVYTPNTAEYVGSVYKPTNAVYVGSKYVPDGKYSIASIKSMFKDSPLLKSKSARLDLLDETTKTYASNMSRLGKVKVELDINMPRVGKISGTTGNGLLNIEDDVAKEAAKIAKRYNLTVNKVVANGPGAGLPSITFSGKNQNIQKLIKWYAPEEWAYNQNQQKIAVQQMLDRVGIPYGRNTSLSGIPKYQKKKLNDFGFVGGVPKAPDLPILRGTTKLTEKDIIDTLPNIKLNKAISAKNVQGVAVSIPKGEKLTPYIVKGNNVLLQDGEAYLVSKNQFQNIAQNSISAKAKPFVDYTNYYVRKQGFDVDKFNKLQKLATKEGFIIKEDPNIGSVNRYVIQKQGDKVFRGEDALYRNKASKNLINAYRSFNESYSNGGTLYGYQPYTLESRPKEYTQLYLMTRNQPDVTGLRSKLGADKSYLVRAAELDDARAAFRKGEITTKQLEEAAYNYKLAATIPNEFPDTHFGKGNIAHSRLSTKKVGNLKALFSDESQADWRRDLGRYGPINEQKIKEYSDLFAKAESKRIEAEKLFRQSQKIEKDFAKSRPKVDNPSNIQNKSFLRQNEPFTVDRQRSKSLLGLYGARNNSAGSMYEPTVNTKYYKALKDKANRVYGEYEKYNEAMKNLVTFNTNDIGHKYAFGVYDDPMLNKWKEEVVKNDVVEAVKRKADIYAWTTGKQQQERNQLLFNMQGFSKTDTKDSMHLTIKYSNKPGPGTLDEGTSFLDLVVDPNTGLIKLSSNEYFGRGKIIGKKLNYIFDDKTINKIMNAKPESTAGISFVPTKNTTFGPRWPIELYDKQKVQTVESLFNTKVKSIRTQQGVVHYIPITNEIKRSVAGKAPNIKTSGLKFWTPQNIPQPPDGIKPTLGKL